MPRFRQISQIQQLMSQKERIRNIGIIAHIDHGKTTLADSLLAGAGLLSPKMAGSARVLDYLEEEQKRKITIKTANITLLYNQHIINLVDTPGHVDFTGRVTRSLRAIDGAVVVVDAVEGIMAQTEIVVRQALEERVRPVLFINKVDRLITELQLNEQQIQQKLNFIINGFNDLIELYCEAAFKSKWKIDSAQSNVAYGSALHGWGFTVNIAKEKGVKFAELINSYLNVQQDKLQSQLPVYEAIFEIILKSVPNPREAQAYRIQKIWDGNVDSKIGHALTECSDNGPAVMCVTNVQSNPEGGCFAVGRLFSGTVKKGDVLHLIDEIAEATVNQVAITMGSFREEVSEVSAGNLAALTLSANVKTGETLVDLAHKSGMVPFEGVNYVSQPVVTVAVEPKNPKDLEVLLGGLEDLAAADPNLAVAISRETGEYLLSGMGELHLEIALKQLKSEYKVDVKASSPRVVYRESVKSKGAVAEAKSPNKQNSFWVQVEPEKEKPTKNEGEDTGEILSFDENRNMLVDTKYKTDELSEEVLESIIAGFEFACHAGPLCGEPVRHVKVKLVGLQISSNEAFSGSVEVMRGIGKAIFGSFLTAQPVLLEPIYKIVLSVASELAGECSKIIGKRRGKVASFEQKGLLTVLSGFIPVSETFGLSVDLRSATSGRAFWQMLFDHWDKMPQKLELQVINDLRKRKGLSAGVPAAEKFME